jgi:nitrogen regulatory protein PII
LPREIAISPHVETQGSRTVVKVTGRGMWPYHVVMLNGQPLETKLTGRNQLEAVVPPEAIANVGTYRITVKSPGEPYPVSNPARLVVRFKP